jgi:hypothetical protein
MAFFKASGVCFVILAVLGFGAVVANRATAELGGHDLAPLSGPAALLLIIGCGLYLRRKWAALLFILVSVAIGGWMIVGSVLAVPMPWMMLNFCFGLGLMAPCALVRRNWSALR